MFQLHHELFEREKYSLYKIIEIFSFNLIQTILFQFIQIKLHGV